MILWCYIGHLSAQSVPTFRHIILPVCRYAVQHALQAVKLVMVKHTDGIDGYLLRCYPAVCDVRLAHRSVTVSMDGTEISIDRFRLLFGREGCCPPVLYVVNHLADRISQYRVLLCNDGDKFFFLHNHLIYLLSACSELGLRFLPFRNSSSRLLISLSLPTPEVPPCSIQPMISSSKK